MQPMHASLCSRPSPFRSRGWAHTRIPARFTSTALELSSHSSNHHGAKRTEERLSARALKEHAEKLSQCIIDGPAWSGHARWKGFMQVVASIVLELDKLSQVLTVAAEAKDIARARTEPARNPQREEDLEGSGLREQREHNDPLFDTLRQSLAQLDDYEMLLVDDALMGISEGSSAAVKTHRRTDFRRKLGLRETAVFVPRISQWGPASAYGTVHVWKVPSEGATEARQSAALARALKQAPQMATRQMMRYFQTQFLNTNISKSILRSMWDCLRKDTARERDGRQEEIDDRVLTWMSRKGVTDTDLFWDLRQMNGPHESDAFTPFWDEMGVYLELEIGAGAHERRAAGSEHVTHAATVISVPQLIRTRGC